MTIRRCLSRWASALVVLGSGCTLYQPRPVAFDVRDGDTGQPISAATVKANYWTMLDFGVLFASIGPREGTTDTDGKLNLIIDPVKSSFHLEVAAIGYDETHDLGRHLGSAHWGRLVRAPWYSVGDHYQVRMYRGSTPTAEIQLPKNYRGPVVVRLETQAEPPRTHGQRAFRYNSSPCGVVAIPEGALFTSLGGHGAVQARRGSEPALRTIVPGWRAQHTAVIPSDETVALRYVWTKHGDEEPTYWLYVVGNEAEAETLFRTVWPDDDHFDEAAFKKLCSR